MRDIPEDEAPDLRWNPERNYVLHSDFEWYDEKKGCHILVPAGFKSDGASVPLMLHVVVDPEDLSEAAWLVHDWLYRYRGMPPHLPAWASYTRAEVDALFNAINLRHGVPDRKRRLAYVGVRVGGYFAWRNERD